MTESDLSVEEREKNSSADLSGERTPDETPEPDRARRKRIAPAALVAVLIALAVATGVARWQQVRAGHDSEARAQVVRVASDGAAALLSYRPDTVDADLAAAKDRLTGDFLDYYNKFTTEVVAPASKEKKIATTATVPAAAVSSIDESTAVVLIFVNQSATTGESKAATESASSVRVQLTRVDGRWLIEKFDPV